MCAQLRLGPENMFCRDQTPVFPVGVNYPPLARESTTDNGDEIRRDLDLIAGSGLTAVRITGGTTRDASDSARAAFVRWCEERGLLVVSDAPLAGPNVLPAEVCVPVIFTARPGKHVLGFDGLGDPLGHSFLPFAVRHAAQRGPVLVTSLGIGASLGARQEDAWLRAVLPATQAAGASGIFWCGWRGTDGLVDESGGVRPGRTYLAEFARDATSAFTPRGSSSHEAVGVFVPRETVEDATMRRAVLAHYFITSLGCDVRVVDEINLRASPCRTVLVPGIPICEVAARELHAWTTAGGRLCWHGPDLIETSSATATLLGVSVVDWRSARGISVHAFGERFTLAHFPADVRVELEPRGASVLAADQLGLPVLLENRLGHGRVRFMLPIVEEAIVPVTAHPTSRDRWQSWYRGMLAE